MTRDALWKSNRGEAGLTHRGRSPLSGRGGGSAHARHRPNPRSDSTPRPRRGGWLIAGLVVVNVAVVVYHGDPRVRAAKAASIETEAPSAASKQPPPSSVDTSSNSHPTAALSRPSPDPSLRTETVPSSDAPAVAEATPPRPGLMAVPNPTTAPERAGPPLPASEEASALEAEDPPFDPWLGLRNPGLVQRVAKVLVQPGHNAARTLSAAGVQSPDIGPSLHSLRSLIDFRRLRPGDTFITRFDAQDRLVSLEVHRGLLDRVRADRDGVQTPWKSHRIEVEVETESVAVSGQVKTSLWAALVDMQKEDPRLVHAVVDIFAWEIDFYSQVFPGDTFRILVQKKFVEDRFVGYGDVLAAEFVSEGHRHRAFLHRRDQAADAVASYYDENGGSLRKQLLKAPLKYGHVTSGFGRRRHPVLGYTRAHNGIDYGVPTGTPVWSVGDGRVLRAGWNGGFGKFVEVRHANGWVSQYAHLSKIRVKAGQRVTQKQVVGAVGSTGMSTGPHLHYGLKRRGAYVNPLKQRFERAKSLSGSELARFKEQMKTWSEELQRIRIAQAPTTPPTEG